ncbi:hypothetical protein GOP47_0029003 [Adiantum capillus-veneris]|nr:hypothetical protein GOP47_0029003 [Adiantum capillus-veneris]
MDNQNRDQLLALEETQGHESFMQVKDGRIDRIEDVLVDILKEFLGDQTRSQSSLHFELLQAISSIKNVIDNYDVNVTDVQVTKLEERILMLQERIWCVEDAI